MPTNTVPTPTQEAPPSERLYLQYRSEVRTPPPGLSHLDVAHPPECPRGYFHEGERIEASDRHPDEIIGRGWAVGREAGGLARVFLPATYRLREFLGFAHANHHEGGRPRLSVVTRGRYLLRVDGLTDEAIGAPVYITGPNSFTVTDGEGFEMGVVVFIEKAGVACVAFKRSNDHEPFDQNLMQVRER